MKNLLLIVLAVTAMSAQTTRAEDVFDEPELSNSLTDKNDLGHGSCAAFQQAIDDFENCLRDNKVTEGSRSGIYKCGQRPRLPDRC